LIQAGHEWETVAHLLTRSSFNDKRMAGIASAFFNPSLPGKIFVEAKNGSQAALSVAELPYITNWIPCIQTPEAMVSSLQCWKSSSKSIERFAVQSWVRLRKGNELGPDYDGDIALITDILDSELHVALLPRLKYEKGLASKKEVFDISHAERIAGVGSVEDKGNGWQFKGLSFTYDGFLSFSGLMPEHAECVEEITASDLYTFSDCESLSASTVKRARLRLEMASLRVGDRVKIKDGEYVWSRGMVQDVDENEAVVAVESQYDMEAGDIQIPINSLMKIFLVGDCVRINEGENLSKIAWVVKVMEENVQIVLIEGGKQASP
jgi:ribosomal protein L24